MNNNVRLAINTTRAAVNAVNEYRTRKAAEAYDALSDVAENYTIAELAEQGKSLIDDRRDSAAKIAENARVRLEKARAEAAASERIADLHKSTRKASKELAKRADKRAVKLGLKQEPKKKNTFGMAAIVTAVLAAVGAALYWFVFRPEKANTVPPRVEEHGAEGSRLVYSTVTPTESEVSPEFLQDLDKQLAEHKAQDAEVSEQAQAINDGEFADEAIDDALDEANVSELNSLEHQAEDAEKKFDGR